MSATNSPVLRARGRVVLRTARPPLSTRVDLRIIGVCAGLTLAIAVAFAVSGSVGDVPIPLVEVLPAIFGHGDPDADFIVRTLRLPRALTGLLVGTAFGLSGAIFQSLARNPLASPDIIGVTAGAGLV